MPSVLDATTTGRFSIKAQTGTTEFIQGKPSGTIGFNQSYLGPVVRITKGGLRPVVENGLAWPISAHWHGLVVPGEHDGGPHLAISQGHSWSPDMEIDQEPCTAFFHTHVHGRTAQDVYYGLAGVMHIVDGLDKDRGLPQTYGIDDLTLVLQDRRFSSDGELQYAGSMMDVMHGMIGNTTVINGQVDPVAVVPKAIVRARIVNASNARIYRLFLEDARPMHLVATDGGYLPESVTINELRLGPGERAEILIDFRNGQNVVLASFGDPNEGMGGMMGRARGTLDRLTGARDFPVLPFVVDDRIKASIDSIPTDLGGEDPTPSSNHISKTRRFSLNMGMGGGMMGMGGGMMRRGRMMGGFAINGDPFDMQVLNEEVRLGATERWIVDIDMLAHPFHIHGVSFLVIKENGKAPLPESRGWKDTIVVDDTTEIIVKFTKPASENTPFMYHCHILEHEDRGMMGQFSVS